MKVSKEILELIPYKPGKPIQETQREYKIQEVYKLASNENAIGPSPKVLDAIQKSLQDLHRYPDPSCYELLQLVSQLWKIPVNELGVGNGSHEIIDLLIRIFCEPGRDSILTTEAAFLAYPLCSQGARIKCHIIPQILPAYRMDLQATADFLCHHPDADSVRLVFIPNPNNPTGTLVTANEVTDFLDKISHKENLLIVFDEAYTDFVRDPAYKSALEFRSYRSSRGVPSGCGSKKPEAASRGEGSGASSGCGPQVVVLRTLSKVYGLAGLRIGLLIAPPDVIDFYNRVRLTFNVNSLAQAAAVAALQDVAYLQQTVQTVWSGLDYFYSELKKLGLPYIESQANFVLFDTLRDSSLMNEALLKKGIILRPVKNYGFQRHLRMSVGLPEENKLAIKALKEALKEVPLLLSGEDRGAAQVSIAASSAPGIASAAGLPSTAVVTSVPLITIDGPAASGKTSVSRGLAKKLSWQWLSTGAFYRGLAYVAHRLNVDLDDEKKLIALISDPCWKVEMSPEKTHVFFEKEDVTEFLTREEVGMIASKISHFPELRKNLLEPQRAFQKIAKGGLVVEGRDCGTVVFPNATLKVFLTARQEDRAERRAKELGTSTEETQKLQTQRDQQDTERKTAPLQQAENALLINTSQMNLEEVIEHIALQMKGLLLK